MAAFTKIYHSAPYEAVYPSNVSNNQSGRCVLITGGSEGIGFEIAAAFQAAQASRIILVGRRPEALQNAVERLEKMAEEKADTRTVIITKVVNIASEDSVKSLWDQLAADKVTVHVLVLNAASTAHGSLFNHLPAAWKTFETNVLANMQLTDYFLHQSHESESKKVLLNISSFMAHAHPAPNQGAYAASKAAFASLLQHLADEIPVEKAQIVSIHPGAILTESARRTGYDEDTLPWDDKSLPGCFCVWASSEDASFLHGKFVWANWDVNELLERSSEISGTPGMLRIGLQGCEFLDPRTVFTQIRNQTARAS